MAMLLSVATIKSVYLAMSTSFLLLVLGLSYSGTHAQITDICNQYDVNGCSIPFNLSFFYNDVFTPSCNRHDICYSCGVAYNITRAVCDASFHGDMNTACKNRFLEPSSTSEKPNYKEEQTLLHKRNILGIIDEDYEKFQSVMKRLMPRYIELSEQVGKYEATDRFVQLFKDHVITKWEVMLEELLRKYDTFSNSIQHKIVLSDSGKEASRPEFYGDVFRRSTKTSHKTSEFSFQFGPESSLYWTKKPVIIFKTKQGAFQTNGAKPKENENTIILDNILNNVDSSATSQEIQKRLTSGDFLTCYFFSEMYFLAVAIFASSHYHNEPEFYCNQSFVPKCLPPSHNNTWKIVSRKEGNVLLDLTTKK